MEVELQLRRLCAIFPKHPPTTCSDLYESACFPSMVTDGWEAWPSPPPPPVRNQFGEVGEKLDSVS
jgi:hypothetical protein